MTAEFHAPPPERIHIRHEAREELADVVDALRKDGGKSQLVDKDEQDIRLRPGHWVIARVEREARARRRTQAGKRTGGSNPYRFEKISALHVQSSQIIPELFGAITASKYRLTCKVGL